MIEERKLEAVAIFVIAAVFLSGIWFNLSKRVSELKTDTSKTEEAAIKCSRLEINYVDRKTNRTHTTVFFSSNIDVRLLEIRFRGSNRSVVKNATNVSRNELRQATAKVKDAEVSVVTPECGNVR